MTIPQRVAAYQANVETTARAVEFLQVARCLMISKNITEAQYFARNSRCVDRVIEALLVTRAAVPAGSMTDATWAGPLAPYSLLADGFLESLRSVSAFDRVLVDALRVPPLTVVATTTAGAAGMNVNEGMVKGATIISFESVSVSPVKSVAFVVLSAELMRMGGRGALALLGRELRKAVGRTTDEVFVTALTTGLTGIPSSGSSSALAVRTDLRYLMDAISFGADARLYYLTTATIAKRLSVIADSAGGRAFPSMTPTGGELDGVPLVVSDGVPSGQLILLDASQLAAFSGPIELDRSEAATLQLNDAPDSPPTAATLYTNLWTQNLAALRAERYFGISRGRTTAAAFISSFTGIGNSPS